LKKYECLYIVNINFDSEGTSAVVAKIEEVLKNVGAEVVNTQHWGKRKLAYAIDKERYGNYILLHFQGENPDVTELQREFEIEKGVLHYMTIRLDEFPDFETLSVPQAFETDRRKPAYGGRKPRRYEDDARPQRVETPAAEPAPASEAVETADAAEAVKDEAVVEEAKVEAVEEATPAAEEVTESADEPTKEEADKPADAE
jgi:small subunit ribosomal protein S6